MVGHSWEPQDYRKEQARDNLKRVLEAFGIKSAAPPGFEQILENMMKTVVNSYGTPDEMFLPGSALNAMLEAMGKDKK